MASQACPRRVPRQAGSEHHRWVSCSWLCQAKQAEGLGPGACKAGGGRLHSRLGPEGRQRAASIAGRRRCMRFILIDQISELVPGQRICAVKALSLAEEYLADHFPRFPIMPGVLMIEALTQASAWLVRVTEDFAHSMHLLSEARNVTYKNMVLPGQVLEMVVEAKEIGDRTSRFVGVGRCGHRKRSRPTGPCATSTWWRRIRPWRT